MNSIQTVLVEGRMHQCHGEFTKLPYEHLYEPLVRVCIPLRIYRFVDFKVLGANVQVFANESERYAINQCTSALDT